MRSGCLNIRKIRAHRSEAGYTILEVLVSVAIFSAIVTLAATALDQGLRQYHRLVDTGINFWDSARFLWMNRSFGCIVDYYGSPGGSEPAFPYFIGSRDLISFVTLAPFASGTAVVAWIEPRSREDGEGRDLVYYELPVYAMNLKEIQDAYQTLEYRKGKSTVLIPNLGDMEVTFYGFDDMTEQWQWTPVYNGSDKKNLPTMVRIDYREKGDLEPKRLYFYVHVNGSFKGDENG